LRQRHNERYRQKIFYDSFAQIPIILRTFAGKAGKNDRNYPFFNDIANCLSDKCNEIF